MTLKRVPGGRTPRADITGGFCRISVAFCRKYARIRTFFFVEWIPEKYEKACCDIG